MYKWTKLDKSIYPLMDDFMLACQSADNDDGASRDSRNMNYALLKMKELNDKVQNAIQIRTSAATIFPWSIIAIGEADEKTKSAIAEAKLRLADAINAICENRIYTVLFGAMLLEFEWKMLDNKKTPVLTKKYNPLEIDKESEFTIRIVDSDTNTVKRLVVLTDIDNVNYIGEVDNNMFRGGKLRTIETMLILANEQNQEWAAFNKKLKGVIQAQYPRGAGDKEKQATIDAAKSLTQHNVIVTSELIKFLFQSLTDSKGATSFKEFIERQEKATEFVLLGQVGTTELPKYGSYAAVEILSNISSDIFISDIRSIEKLVNKLLLVDYRLNYVSQATSCPWKFLVDIPEELSKVEKMDVVDSLSTNNIPVRADELYRFIGFSKPENTQDILFDKPNDNSNGF